MQRYDEDEYDDDDGDGDERSGGEDDERSGGGDDGGEREEGSDGDGDDNNNDNGNRHEKPPSGYRPDRQLQDEEPSSKRRKRSEWDDYYEAEERINRIRSTATRYAKDALQQHYYDKIMMIRGGSAQKLIPESLRRPLITSSITELGISYARHVSFQERFTHIRTGTDFLIGIPKAITNVGGMIRTHFGKSTPLDYLVGWDTQMMLMSGDISQAMSKMYEEEGSTGMIFKPNAKQQLALLILTTAASTVQANRQLEEERKHAQGNHGVVHHHGQQQQVKRTPYVGGGGNNVQQPPPPPPQPIPRTQHQEYAQPQHNPFARPPSPLRTQRQAYPQTPATLLTSPPDIQSILASNQQLQSMATSAIDSANAALMEVS